MNLAKLGLILADQREILGVLMSEATIITYSECDDLVHSSGTKIHIVAISDWLTNSQK